MNLFIFEGKRRNRPMSTVVLPISPVGDEQESDNESDWGSDFDQSLPNDQEENDDEFYEIIGDMSKRRTPNVKFNYPPINHQLSIIQLSIIQLSIMSDSRHYLKVLDCSPFSKSKLLVVPAGLISSMQASFQTYCTIK